MASKHAVLAMTEALREELPDYIDIEAYRRELDAEAASRAFELTRCSTGGETALKNAVRPPLSIG